MSDIIWTISSDIFAFRDRTHLTPSQRVQKRSFDLVVSIAGLLVLWPIILIAIAIATFDTKMFGVFMQRRLGQNMQPFMIYKIRTMASIGGSTITSANDVRITRWGRFFRKSKIDELPQLINVALGHMSFVGPRPDVPGYLDKAGPEFEEVCALRPGITGPATLLFKNEGELLDSVGDPETYNDTVIWPKKLEINKHYAETWSLIGDLEIILRTVGLRK